MKTNLIVGLRLFFASLILFLVGPSLTGFVLAGAVMSLPSFKNFRGRLATGAQTEEETPELKAINSVAKQFEGFKESLGKKADLEAFSELKKLTDDMKKNVDKWSEAKVDETIKTINAAVEKLGKQVEEMQEDVAKAKENGGRQSKSLPFVSTEEIQKFINETFKDGQKTSSKAAIKLNSAGVFKTAETFGIPTFFEGAAGTITDVFTGRVIDPTLYQRKRKRNLILDNFMIESVTAPKLIYLEKIEIAGDDQSQEDVGGADWITSGAEKPKRSFRVTTGSVEAKKVAIFGTIEDKLLRDVPSVENWIREDFLAEIMEAYNDALLNNNPAVNADAPLGLKQNAIQYAATTAFNGTISTPNEIDMIVAAIAYMASLKEQAAKAFVSDDIFYKLHILKDSEGRYQNNNLVYISNTGQLYIGGIPVIPSDSEDVPSTHLLVTGADLGFKIKNYGSMTFERGLNGSDFREDKTSYRGYQEVLSYIPSHRENSVLYDTFANILAAIELAS